jgi:hypothetical protein
MNRLGRRGVAKTAMPYPDATPDDVERLQELLATSKGYLTDTQYKQVGIVRALLAGRPQREIAAEHGLQPPAISSVSKKLKEQGLRSMLDAWEAKFAAAIARRSEARTTPGRKGINLLVEWLDKQTADGEPIIELARLLLAPDCLIALFAVREPRESGDTRITERRFRKIFLGPVQLQPFESRLSFFDLEITDLLQHVGAFTSSLHDIVEPALRLPYADLPASADFGPHYKFLALTRCDSADLDARQWLGGAPGGPAQPEQNVMGVATRDEFFERLFSILFQLRQTRTPGLLPTYVGLAESIRKWGHESIAQPPHVPFCWRTDEKEVEACAKHIMTLGHYNALFGGLTHMGVTAWNQLPWKEEFPLQSVRLRPRIEEKDADGSKEIHIYALPQLGVRLRPPEVETAPLDARTIRGKLREARTELTFRYSNRQRSHGWWAGLLMVLLADRKPGEVAPAAVLLPRRFVGHESGASLDMHASIAESSDEGAFLRFLVIGEEPEECCVFNAPSLIPAILEVFKSNRYGDEVHRLYRAECDFAAYLRDNCGERFPLEGESVHGISGLHPSYWHFDQETEMESGEEEPEWRRQVLAVRAKFIAGRRGLSEQDAEALHVSNDESFRNVLNDCDADFLLLGLSAETRLALDTLTDGWRNLLLREIGSACDFNRAEGRRRIFSAIPRDLRSWAGNHEQDIWDWTQDALLLFGQTCQRVTRRAIETAQRLSLARKNPHALTIETRGSLLGRWHRFLHKRLKGAILSALAQGSKMISLDEDELFPDEDDSDDSI